jgi:hypothetical protein
VSEAATPRLWSGLEPVDARLGAHAIRWEAGELVLVDHPDPEAEEALAALGGARCPCLDLLAAWRAQHVDPSVLTVGPHHPGEPVRLDPEVVERLQADAQRWRNQWAGVAADLRAQGDTPALARLREIAAPAERALAARLGFLQLLTLDPLLIHRLIATVTAEAADKWRESPPDDLPPRWRAALDRRGVTSLDELGSQWREGSGARRG